ncbi:MAG: hypothetical protein ACOC8F_08250 [Planctomycetota bacterium]
MRTPRHIPATAWRVVAATGLLAGGLWTVTGPATAQDPSTRPGGAAGGNLEYWLERATPATAPADGAADAPASRPADDEPDAKPGPCPGLNALPGVVELSNGHRLAGWVTTTAGKPWEVFVDSARRWRRVPPAAALSIEAVVVAEEMTLRWRWKGMGEPERVYTGKRYPTRRLEWRFRLADGSALTGTVKGQPLWVRCGRERHGPFVLQERMAGEDGQSLNDLVYVKRVVISRRAMRAVLDP